MSAVATAAPSGPPPSRLPARLWTLLSLLASSALLLVSAFPAAALEVPYLSGRVNDQADLLTPRQEAEMEEELRAFEQETGAQVVVLTLPSLEGEPLEDYSLRVAETWGLGREEADDGVLLLVARDDRKLRLEVGYGLEPVLTDLESKIIIDEIIVPNFRQGEFGAGIREGVEAILASLRGEELPAPAEPVRVSTGSGDELEGPARYLFFLIFALVVGLFSFVAVLGEGCQGWFLYFFLMPFYGMFPTAAFGPRAGIAFLGGWIVLFPLLRLLLRNTARGRRWTRGFGGGTFASGGWTTSFGGGSGGGFSGGGFSGGGGSFGGGGASGSW